MSKSYKFTRGAKILPVHHIANMASLLETCPTSPSRPPQALQTASHHRPTSEIAQQTKSQPMSQRLFLIFTTSVSTRLEYMVL